jgi:hypothetical protein
MQAANSDLQESDIESAVSKARQRFIEANPASQDRQRQATASMPGGNTRAVLWYSPFPLTLVSKRGKSVKRQIDGDERSPVEQHAAMTWAQRLKRVFSIDISICEECGGAVKVIASIEDPAVIKQILGHLQRKAVSKEFDLLPESRAPPQIGLFG